jgi:exopolysaccharide biosynthesis polyprenyl glycosylphosphotransferase
VGRSLARNLQSSGEYFVVGLVDDDFTIPDFSEMRLLGGRDEVPQLVQEYAIDEIFVAYAPSWQQRLADTLAVNHPHVQLHVVPSIYETMMCLARVRSRADIPVLQIGGRTGIIDGGFGRVFDLCIATVGLIVLGPLMAMLAVLIKLASPGPAIFSQERIGRGGRSFHLYKFRTMIHNAEAGTGSVLANGSVDPRLTRIGRWLRLARLDEIPQLWNVLRGEMSVVGPRPERPFFVKKYERSIPSYSKRSRVRPGITGLAQVCAGNHTDARDKLRFDLIYISHKSVWFDIKILCRSFAVVLIPARRKQDRTQP